MLPAGKVVENKQNDVGSGAIWGKPGGDRSTSLKRSCRKERACSLWREGGIKLWILPLYTARYSDSCVEVERGSFGRQCRGLSGGIQRLLKVPFKPDLSSVSTSVEDLR